MKQIVAFLLCFFAVLSCYADKYRILQMNTETIRIGNRYCHSGDVFTDDETIFWEKSNQAMKVRNERTKEIFIFVEPDFKKKSAKSINSYYIKNNHLSTASVNMDSVSSKEGLYLFDKLKVNSPHKLRDGHYLVMSYSFEGRTIEKKLKVENNRIVFFRSDFPMMSAKLEITIYDIGGSFFKETKSNVGSFIIQILPL